ncbi:hypothetical protein SLS60_005463 [Paraconiothyrium brasiliense]|uniref:Uncharacterized protein n=1 Tax=Paraconiothyrium brasiliense TaxID=300254 RepID=A0ABR3RHG4_9PLEO
MRVDSTYGIYLLTLVASNQGPRVLRALNLDDWDSPDPFLNVYFHRGLYTAYPAARFAQLCNELNKRDEGSGPSDITDSSGLNDINKAGGLTDIIEAGGPTESSGLTDIIETDGITEGNGRPSDILENHITLGLPGRHAVSEVFVKRTRNMDTFRNMPLHGTERPTITSDNVKDLFQLLYRCKGQNISTGVAGVNPLIIIRRQQEANEQTVSLICLSLLTADPTVSFPFSIQFDRDAGTNCASSNTPVLRLSLFPACALPQALKKTNSSSLTTPPGRTVSSAFAA